MLSQTSGASALISSLVPWGQDSRFSLIKKRNPFPLQSPTQHECISHLKWCQVNNTDMLWILEKDQEKANFVVDCSKVRLNLEISKGWWPHRDGVMPKRYDIPMHYWIVCMFAHPFKRVRALQHRTSATSCKIPGNTEKKEKKFLCKWNKT